MQVVSTKNADGKIIESMSCNDNNVDRIREVVKANTISCGLTEDQFTINVMQNTDFFTMVKTQNNAVPKVLDELGKLKKNQTDLIFQLMNKGVI